MTQATGLLVVSIDVDPSFERELNDWYHTEHLPERLECPGFLSARRWLAVEGGPRYLATYHLRDIDVLHEEPYLALGETAWTKRVRQHVSLNRAVYREIPSSGPDEEDLLSTS